MCPYVVGANIQEIHTKKLVQTLQRARDKQNLKSPTNSDGGRGGWQGPWPPPQNFLNFFFFRRRWWYWPNSGGSVGCSGGGFSRDGGVGFVGTVGFGTTWWPP
jgi:hypothetical protein